MSNEYKSSLKDAIIDLRTTQDEIRKRVESDLIMKNESVIKDKVAILLEKELYPNSDEKEEDESSDSEVNSVTIIDKLLDDIDLSSIEDENLSDDESSDSSLSQGSNDQDKDEEVDEAEISDFDELIKEMSLDTKTKNESKNEVMTEKVKTEDEIQKKLSEMEEMISEKSKDEDKENIKEESDNESSNLEIEDELEELSEEELLEIINEMTDEEEEMSEDMDSEMEEMSEEKESEEEEISEEKESDEESVEEGMAYSSQTKKTVGSKSSAQRDGAPERRSNLSESLKMLQDKFTEILAENKTYKNKVHKLEEKMGGFYEMAINSSKMTQMNKIITENFDTLTKEKLNDIISKFSSVETIKESKETYNTLNESFKKDADKLLQENINKKIDGKIESESGKAIIKSPKTTKDSLLQEQISRMKNIINYQR